MLSLFEGEKIVSQSNDKSVTLTTHRILYTNYYWGNSYNQNIALEHITSCENRHVSYVILLFLAVGSILLSFSNGEFVGAILASIAFLLIFKFTKRNLIIISSPSTKITFVAKMNKEKVLEFIDLIEATKFRRINNLKKIEYEM